MREAHQSSKEMKGLSVYILGVTIVLLRVPWNMQIVQYIILSVCMVRSALRDTEI